MTTLQQTKFQCPVCEEEFESKVVTSTNSFGGKTTDFRERAAGTQPHGYKVVTCPACYYTAEPRSWQHGLDADYFQIDQLQAQLNEIVAREDKILVGSVKWHLAALIAQWAGEIRKTADCYLYAAWCCINEGDTEAERFYRIEAARAFTKALDAECEVEADERAVLAYLVGELWRRIGDKMLANAWFMRVREEITDQATQQWIIDAADQQSSCPREWFA